MRAFKFAGVVILAATVLAGLGCQSGGDTHQDRHSGPVVGPRAHFRGHDS